jgi:hypothetical protein
MRPGAHALDAQHVRRPASPRRPVLAAASPAHPCLLRWRALGPELEELGCPRPAQARNPSLDPRPLRERTANRGRVDDPDSRIRARSPVLVPSAIARRARDDGSPVRMVVSRRSGRRHRRTLSTTPRARCAREARPLVTRPTISTRAHHRPRSVLPISPSGHGAGLCARSAGSRSGASGDRDRPLRGPRDAVGEDLTSSYRWGTPRT